MKLSISVSGIPCRDGTTAACRAEIETDEFDEDVDTRIETVHRTVGRCVQTIRGDAMSSASDYKNATASSAPPDGAASAKTAPRSATAKQVAAIKAIARRKSMDLDPMLQQQFGKFSVSALTIKEASSLIDELKKEHQAA